MKQKDIVLILFIVGISGLASYYITKLIFVKDTDKNQQVKIVDKINTDFSTPNKQFFNGQSVNPTQIIIIGDTQQNKITN